MEVELNLNGTGRRIRWSLVVLVVVGLLVGIGALGAVYTVEADGEPMLLTPARYSLYRYRTRVAGWCRDLDRADAVLAEVVAHREPDALVYGPTLRGAWSSLDDVARRAQAAPVDALSLRVEVLTAVDAYREALTAAGVYVNRPTKTDRLALREALRAARNTKEVLCPSGNETQTK